MEDTGVEVGDGNGVAKQVQDVIAGTGDCASAPLIGTLEMAAHEFGTKKDDDGESKKCREESGAKGGCQNLCRDHKRSPMNPRIWGDFLPELFGEVVSHLPVEDSRRLQFLNKEWRQIMLEDSKHFRGTKMACLITECEYNTFWVKVWDFNHSKWHTYKLPVSRPDVDFAGDFGEEPLPTMSAACEDGGLVCFVTSWNPPFQAYSRIKDATHWRARRCGILLNVLNPLTGKSPDVPPLVDMQEAMLVRIQVDRETKQFKLLVVAGNLALTDVNHVNAGWTVDDVTAQVYNSVTREWTAVDECLNSKINIYHNPDVSYDFENGWFFAVDYGLLQRIGSERPDHVYSLYNGRLFALKLGSNGPANEGSANQSPTFFIEEFHWETGLWVNLKTHRCEPFEHTPRAAEYRMRLLACHGFLMVFAQPIMTPPRPIVRPRNYGDQARFAWIYDVSRMKWSILDRVPELRGRYHGREVSVTNRVDLMFEA